MEDSLRRAASGAGASACTDRTLRAARDEALPRRPKWRFGGLGAVCVALRLVSEGAAEGPAPRRGRVYGVCFFSAFFRFARPSEMSSDFCVMIADAMSAHLRYQR